MSEEKNQYNGIDLNSALEVFISAPTPYLVLAPDFTIIDANESRLTVTSSTREKTIGRPLFEAFPDNPDDLNATGVNNLRASLETVLKTKKSHKMAIQKYDIPVNTPEGEIFEERYWSPLNFPILDSTGNVKYIIHQVEDVTEEIQSKKNLKNLRDISKAIETERARLLSIFNQAPIGICLFKGSDLIIEFANNTYRKITGEKRKLDGLPFAEAFADFGPESLALTMNTLLRGEHKIVEDLRVTTDWDQTGKPYEKIFMVILEPLKGANGKAEGVITLAFDDTEKIRMRLESKKALEDLQQEKDLRERFVASLSHDLLTPLTAAKMSAQLLGRKAGEQDTVRKFSEKILSSLERCNQMIMNLLDANRIKAGETLPVELSDCSLKKIVTETIEELTTVHGERFSLFIPESPVEGRWSCGGIKRILENLCINAVKYGAKDTKINVYVKEIENEVSLSVQNWGNPISAEDQIHVFDLYRRAGTEKNPKTMGWGLGLTLVRGIAEAHHGKVTVHSSEEKGTLFTVSLPKNYVEQKRSRRPPEIQQ